MGWGTGSGYGLENYRPGPFDEKGYAYTYTGSGTLSDENGTLTRADGAGVVTYTSGGGSAGGGTPYTMDSVGTVDISSIPFVASCGATVPVAGGTVSVSWAGKVLSKDRTPWDIDVQEARWRDGLGAEFKYAMPGGVRTAPSHSTPVSSIEVFWATGTTTDTILGSPIGSVPVYWNQASGTAEVTDLEIAPPSAKYLLFVGDIDQKVSEPDESNNLIALAIPDIVASSLTWNPAELRVDYSYDVKDADLPQATTGGLYWSADATFDAGDVLANWKGCPPRGRFWTDASRPTRRPGNPASTSRKLSEHWLHPRSRHCSVSPP